MTTSIISKKLSITVLLIVIAAVFIMGLGSSRPLYGYHSPNYTHSVDHKTTDLSAAIKQEKVYESVWNKDIK